MNIRKPIFWNNLNIVSFLLIPFSTIIFVINFFKKYFIKKKFKIKTICVGNIYVGGTGKTSLSIEINNILKKKFKTVFIKKKYTSQFDEQKLLKTHGKFLSHSDRKMSLKKAENSSKFSLAILYRVSGLFNKFLFLSIFELVLLEQLIHRYNNIRQTIFFIIIYLYI